MTRPQSGLDHTILYAFKGDNDLDRNYYPPPKSEKALIK
jgi:hypothetical protein